MGAEEIAEKKARRGRRPRKTNYLLPLGTVLAAAVLWEVYVGLFKVPIYIIPAPSAILSEIVASPQMLLEHTRATLAEIVLGFLISILVAIPIAVVIAYSRKLDDMFQPLLVFLQTVPKLAVAPLFLIWFGFGFLPKLLVIILISFFPIVVSTLTGLKSVEREMLLLMRSLKATWFQTFVKVSFPNALPHIFSGLKVAITLSVVGAVAAEWIVSEEGLGYLLLFSASNIRPRMLFAALMILSGVGYLLYSIICAVERRIITYEAEIS
ncbi:MAG: ABC transporter permease [Deltaproteobacteria bacterium]|nr:ABC transporter permease [Deltaproteobacteria bacterium]